MYKFEKYGSLGNLLHKIAEKNTNHDSSKQIPQRERRIQGEVPYFLFGAKFVILFFL